ncbi:MAG: hypothetical protein WBB96_18005 [Candidatus Dechloromonas phosphoritropha]
MRVGACYPFVEDTLEFSSFVRGFQLHRLVWPGRMQGIGLLGSPSFSIDSRLSDAHLAQQGQRLARITEQARQFPAGIDQYSIAALSFCLDREGRPLRLEDN